MNDTTETNDNPASTTVAENDTPTQSPPALTFARDRRKYTRFLDPLHTGPGLQLFESPEHEALGDGLTFMDASGQPYTQTAPNTNYFPMQYAPPLSFGQILALAGDFYGDPSQPISDGSTPQEQQTRFLAAFNTLYQEQAVFGIYMSQQILKVMQQQSTAVSNMATALQALQPKSQDTWSRAYTSTNSDYQYDKAYNLASGAVDSTPWYSSKGSYLQLAAVNWDHFGANAIAAYQAGHAQALETAAGGDYQRAYAMEAFAQHFLTDLFSSGHLRTPRKALHTSNSFSDLCSKLMHDEDSYNGLVVQNAQGKVWIAYGDKRLNDPVNQINFGMARAAVQASLDEVINALLKKDGTPTFAALSLIPDLGAVTSAFNRDNWSPLYVLQNGEPLVRDELSDLRCRIWTANFLYASTYARVPAGGVHSLTGAPPGQGISPAHVVTWQSHRIIGSNEDDLAPAAAMVTTYDPQIGNDTPITASGGGLPPGLANPALQNTLCVVFRKTSSDSSNHHLHFLAIPMTDAPAFKVYASKDIAFNGQATHATDGGDPAVVAQPGSLLMVYPDNSGVLRQATWTMATGTWSAPSTNTLFSGNFPLIAPGSGDAPPRVALCNLQSAAAASVSSAGLYLAFPTRTLTNGGNILIASRDSQGTFTAPQPLSFAGSSGTVYPKTGLSVSLVEFDNALVLAYVDATSNGAIRLLQSADGKNWTMLGVFAQNPNGTAITTHSALSLVPYGGQLFLLVNDSSGNITTHAYVPLTQAWLTYLIQGTSNGKTNTAPLQTKFALSAVGWQGDAYVVFTDKANGAPSIMTTAATTS